MPTPVAETDADGRFRLDGLTPLLGTDLGSAPEEGPMALVARALDFGIWRGTCQVRRGETTEVEITLAAGCVVEGRVLDAQGAPVAGAAIRADRDPAPTYPRFDTCSANSKADGSFRLDSVPDGAVTIQASKQGKASTTLRLAAGTSARWNATLVAGPSLVGRVVDEHGKARPRFVVECASYDINGARRTNRMTDADGRFAILGLRDEPLLVTVFASYTDFASHEVHDVRPGDGELVLTVPDRALPSARVRGTVVGPGGKPPPGAAVYLWLRRRGMGPGFVIDETTGAFSLGPVPPGDYRVVAGARECPDVHLGSIHLDAGATVDLGRLEVGRAGHLRARVLDAEGEAIADAARDHVAVLTETGAHVTGVTIRGGIAEIAALAPGDYLAQWKSTLAHFSVVADQTAELTLRPQARSTCTLVVREANARKAERPREHVEIDVLDERGHLLDRTQRFAQHRDGDTWRDEVLAVADPVQVVVRVEGRERARRTVKLTAGIEIVLD